MDPRTRSRYIPLRATISITAIQHLCSRLCVPFDNPHHNKTCVPPGAFVLPYLIMLVVTGIPLFFLETAFGQYSSSGVIGIWNAVPLFQGIYCI